MTPLFPITFAAPDVVTFTQSAARIVVFADESGVLGKAARSLPRAVLAQIARVRGSDAFAKLKPAEGLDIGFPAGLQSAALSIVHLPRRASADQARRAGAWVGARLAEPGAVLALPDTKQDTELMLGLRLRAWAHHPHKTSGARVFGPVTALCADPVTMTARFAGPEAVAEGVTFARSLTAEPANVLTTQEFVTRLEALRAMGVTVEVLDETAMAALGMRCLLAVGQGSDSPSYAVVLRWNGAETAPLALIGKGVVFDTGGISLKKAPGMEEMTMDMGGAAVVAGVMRSLALRKAPAHVVGIVGLVENMPSGRATRPGDIVVSMKGDSVEILNTDAEGRLVLADLLWYAQERFAPMAMIDLATLTGAVITALGHDYTGVFSNDEALCDPLLNAAQDQGEGAWRMPLSEAFDKRLKSELADMKNIGGGAASASIAAQFLQRFVKPETPWVHLDIAGTALTPTETALAPKGVTGWGVRTLDALIRAKFGG